MPPINDEDFLAWNRFQVGLAVTTGVLVIIITTTAVILLGRQQEPGTTLPTRSPRPVPVVNTATPSLAPSASESASVSPSVKPSASKKTPGPVVTTQVPALSLTLSCPDAALPNAQVECAAVLSGPAPVDYTIIVTSDNPSVGLPGPVTFPAGQTSKAFEVTLVAEPGQVVIDAEISGVGKDSETIFIL